MLSTVDERPAFVSVVSLLTCCLWIYLNWGCQVTEQRSLHFHNDYHESKQCIETFQDTILPIEKSLFGQQRYPILGRVILMRPIKDYKPLPSETIKARFEISTRKGNKSDIDFEAKERLDDPLLERLCNQSDRKNIPFSLTELSETNFDPKKRTIIMVPGYLTADHVPWMHNHTNTWLELEDFNIIMVTWKSANQGAYEQAVSNVPLVARQIIILLHYLTQLNNIELSEPNFMSNIHIVGHSLGAHIGAMIGRDFQGQIGRLSGLDPAGPILDEFQPFYRIDKQHAKLVDVYHSNMGIINRLTLVCSAYYDGYVESTIAWMLRAVCPWASNMAVEANSSLPGSWFGIDKAIGHLDYYLNDGRKQPGCQDLSHLCDHGRAAEMVKEVLDYEKFLRRAFGNDSTKDRSRQLSGFRAGDYHTFIHGLNYVQFKPCQWMLQDPYENNLNYNKKRSLNDCTVPIDFISPPKDFRKTLIQRYGLNLSGSAPPNSVFLKTTKQEPLLGDHLLLKLKLSPESDWDNTCRYQLHATFGDDEMIITKTGDQLELIDHDMLAYPIRNPENKMSRLMLEEMVDEPECFQEPDFQPQVKGKFFPNSIFIKILAKTPKASKETGNHSSKSSESVLEIQNRQSRSSSKCQLDLLYILVQPIWDNERTLYGIYTTNDDFYAPFDVMNSTEFLPDDPRHRVRLTGGDQRDHASLRIVYIDPMTTMKTNYNPRLHVFAKNL